MIAIFWIMGVLSMAVFATLAVVKVQADISTSESHARRARVLAEKGIALATHQNIANGDPLLFFQDRQFAEGYQASRTSLAQTFGINSLTNEVLQQQLTNEGSLSSTLFYQLLTEGWEMDEGDAQTFLHSLVEWVDPDDQVTTLTGWERYNYEREGLDGRPYNRFFTTLEEVTLVHGFDALKAVKPDWKRHFNIWTTGGIDLASATPELISLASLTDFGRKISVEAAALMQERLLGEDGVIGTEDDLPDATLDSLLLDAASDDISAIQNRYRLEGENPEYALITSKGWSGSITLTIKLALQMQSGRPLILERSESIDHQQHEE